MTWWSALEQQESTEAKIVYNACFGGFSLSDLAIRRYAEIKGIDLYPEKGVFGFTTWWTVPEHERAGRTIDSKGWYNHSQEERIASNLFHSQNAIYDRDIPRDDPALAQVVEELGSAANGAHAKLRIQEVPSGTLYRIDEYDGSETVQTKDTYDWSVAP